MFFHKKPRREIVPLNVIPMIDVFSMIIIFLIMGTIFGEASIDVPNWLEVPKSTSKENVENAPRILITQNEVITNFNTQKIPLSEFRSNRFGSLEMQSFVSQIRKYVDSIPPEVRQGGVLLNVIADQSTPYRDIFDVMKVFRGAGFESILFVAEGAE